MRQSGFVARLMAILAAGLLMASAAFADYQQDIVRQLQGMGFDRIEVSRTLLGRVRITAFGADGSREIILNPNTGEILRDLWSRPDGSADARGLLEDRPRPGEDGRARSDQRNDGSGKDGGEASSDENRTGDGSGSGANSGSGSGGNSGSGGKSGGSDHGSGHGRDGGSDRGSDDDSDGGKDSGSDKDDDGGDDD